MDERPPADEQAGARRWAAWLGLVAAAVPLVENAGLAVTYGGGAFGLEQSVPAAVLSLAFGLVLRTGVPLVGAVLVLRGGSRATAGLAVLVAYGILQLPSLVGLTWQVLAAGLPPTFWLGLAAPVAAGVAAGLALRGTAELGERSLAGGRGLVAAAALAMAVTTYVSSVAVVTPSGGMGAYLTTWGGAPIWAWPYVVLEALHPAALLVLAAAILVLRPLAAVAAVAGVVLVFAVVNLAGLAAELAFPFLPEAGARLAVQPAFGLEILAVVLAAVGFTMLWLAARP